jgi:two-component system sensor histidine kinase PilS (NtrC family)
LVGEPLIRRYVLARSGLAIGASALIAAAGASRSGWILLVIGATIASAVLSLLVRGERTRLGCVVAGDLVLSAMLIPASGAASSPFMFLPFVSVLLVGTVAGVRLAIATAAVATLVLLATLSLTPPAGGTAALAGPHAVSALLGDPEAVLRLCAVVAFLVLVAAVAGYLGERFRARTRQLDRAYRDLNRSRVDTMTILESLRSGLITLGPDGRIALINSAACEILALPRDMCAGARVSRVLTGRLGAMAGPLSECLRGGACTTRVRAEITDPAGASRVIGLSTVPIRHGDSVEGVVCVFQDLTDVEVEEARQRRRDRLASLGEFSASVVHELRNYLKPLSGSVELLVDDLGNEPRYAPLLATIRDECDSLESFFEEFLEFAGERPLRVQPLDVDGFLAQTTARVRRHPSASDATIRVRNDASATYAVDVQSLGRAIYNVVLNAVQAAPQGEVLVHASDGPDASLVLRVCDRGPGVPDELREKVFEPFFTGRRGGTGLGLAVARRTTERHRGTIEVKGREGGGTIVEVRIPRVPADAVTARAAA